MDVQIKAGETTIENPWRISPEVASLLNVNLSFRPITSEPVLTVTLLCWRCRQRHTLEFKQGEALEDGAIPFTAACPTTGETITLVGRFGE